MPEPYYQQDAQHGHGERRSQADRSAPEQPQLTPATAATDATFDSERNGDDSSGNPSSATRRPLRKRRLRLPILLFLATCLSTFIAGAALFSPLNYVYESLLIGNATPLRRILLTHWQDGLIYMVCVLAILLTHEMGHFLATVRYRIPASFPFFIPFPISPFGTMGAVIGMDGTQANRKEMFDIGLAGPLAGLVVALPIMWIGIQQLDLTVPEHGAFTVDLPLATQAMMYVAQPAGYEVGTEVWHSEVNPYFMAGWVGLFITGLNMLPVSQLDGGHVIYALFGKAGHWIARGFMVAAVVYLLVSQDMKLILMVLLVLFIGIDHPPTRDDTVPLGWFRTALGYASLAIPLLCFAPRILIIR